MLVEGGPMLAGSLFDAEIDELRLFMAPILVGAADARAVLEERASRGSQMASGPWRPSTSPSARIC